MIDDFNVSGLGNPKAKTNLDFIIINGTVHLKIDSVHEFADYLIEDALITNNIAENDKLYFIMGLEYFKERIKEETQKLMCELDLKDIDGKI